MFEPVNELERLLIAGARDPVERPAFSRALLASDLFLSPTAPPDEEGRVPGVRAAPLNSGETAAAVFTTPERLIAVFGNDALVLGNKGRALLGWLQPGPVVLNPGADYGVVWTRADLEALLDGMVTTTLEHPTEVMLGHPAQRPNALISRLSAAFGAEPAVRGAWLMLAKRGDQPQQSWMMGVDHTGDWKKVQAAIRTALDGFTVDRPLDVMDISDKPSDTLRTGIPLIAAQPPSSAPKKRGLLDLFR